MRTPSVQSSSRIHTDGRTVTVDLQGLSRNTRRAVVGLAGRLPGVSSSVRKLVLTCVTSEAVVINSIERRLREALVTAQTVRGAGAVRRLRLAAA